MDSESEEKRGYLYAEIADLLENDIIDGDFPNGKLPSEQALAAKYQVSRSIVREALKILAERRLVTTVVGSGAYLVKPNAQDLSQVFSRIMSTHDIDCMDAYDVRIILETAAITRAAQQITEEELEALNKTNEKMKDPLITPEEHHKYDFSFHMQIIEASHNPLLILMTQAISSVIDRIVSLSNAGAAELKLPPSAHNRIMQAIREHDPLSAERLMYSHLYYGRHYFQKYFELHPIDGENGKVVRPTYIDILRYDKNLTNDKT